MSYTVKGGEKLKADELIATWVEQYTDRLTYVAYTYVHNQTTAEDIVQEAFIKAFKSLHQLRNAENPLPWLIRIVINECNTTKRKKWNEVVTSVTPEQSTVSTEDIYVKKTRDREIYQAIMSLPEKYRIPIILFYFEDLSLKEIAEAMNIHEGTTRTRLARGRGYLENILERGNQDESRRANSKRKTKLYQRG